MVNYFFVNPAAGQGEAVNALIKDIELTSQLLGTDSIIYKTKSVGDGEREARRICEEINGQPARFFACGGDGTNNEIINGARGFDNIILGCIPIGTGNDFVRNFPGSGDFLSVKDQLLGSTELIDVIQYEGVCNGRFQRRYCVNMFNIGFDCNVVELAGRLKKKPGISGSLAYLLAVGGVFVQKKGIDLKLLHNDEVILDEEVLLCSIANGSYCGGGMKTSPQSSITDGVFDLNIVRDVTRGEFLRLFPKYKKGTHLSVKGIEDVIKISKWNSLTLIPNDKNFFLCADGEIYVAETIDFQLIPKAIKFNVPHRSDK